MQLLPDGPYRRELQVQDAEDNGRPRDELVAARTALLGDSADDAITARCAAALARLGAWAPQIDDLHARSVLPDAEYETLRAVCRTEAGEPGLAGGSGVRGPAAADDAGRCEPLRDYLGTAANRCSPNCPGAAPPTQ